MKDMYSTEKICFKCEIFYTYLSHRTSLTFDQSLTLILIVIDLDRSLALSRCLNFVKSKTDRGQA